MPPQRLLPAIIAMAALLPVFTIGQTQAPREGAYTEGTGSIAGIVVAADTGTPLSRAVVTLGGGPVGLAVFTDNAGRFVLERLAPGQYTLTAARAGYLSLSYGQIVPGRGSGLPIALKDAERLTGVRWALPRAASVSGRILDHAGHPMGGAIVGLHQRRTTDGEMRLVSCCGQATADADGLYRITGLPPGDYAVSALPPAEYRVIPEVLSSFGNETREVTDEEIRWALAQIKNDQNARIAGTPQPPEPPRGRTVSYGRVYFPGVTEAGRATVITLASGEDRRGMDFSQQLQPAAFVRGRVIAPGGNAPANARFAFSDGWSTSTIALPADGTFERRNLLPGRYTLTVYGQAGLWGGRTIDLNGVDLTDIEIVLGPGASVAGRVVFDSGETPPTVASAPVTVVLSPRGNSASAVAAADGTFLLTNVDPGSYRISASMPAASRGPWVLKSAVVNGRDVADVPVEIGPGQTLDGVVVTFTNRATRLSGTLMTADDAPAAGYYVVAFSDDPIHWRPGSRRVLAPARAATDGRFSFTGLPAGSYRLAALTAVDASDLADPSFLAALKPNAILITIAEGEARTQDVKFSRAR